MDLAETRTSRWLDALQRLPTTPTKAYEEAVRMGNSRAAEDGMGAMDKGRHRYSKGDYAGALEAFTEVYTAPLCLTLV